MKAIKYLAMGLALSSILFVGCKKSETTATKVSGSSLLTGKDWRIIGIVQTVPGTPSLDIFAAMPACQKDDLEEFMSNGVVTDKAGASKCDPAEPDSAPGGFWALLNNDAQLRIINGDTTIANVKELTATSLKLELVLEDQGIVYTTNITMVKN